MAQFLPDALVSDLSDKHRARKNAVLLQNAPRLNAGDSERLVVKGFPGEDIRSQRGTLTHPPDCYVTDARTCLTRVIAFANLLPARPGRVVASE